MIDTKSSYVFMSKSIWKMRKSEKKVLLPVSVGKQKLPKT